MKNKTFLDSLKCAFNGLFYGAKTEKTLNIILLSLLHFLYLI